MASQSGPLQFSYRDPGHMTRPALLQALRQLWRFTKLRLNEFDTSYYDILCSQEAPNMQVLEIASPSNHQTYNLPDALFCGRVPGNLVELSLVRTAVGQTSPFLRVHLSSLRVLTLDRCGAIWANQEQMFQTLQLLPNLERLFLAGSIPPPWPMNRPPQVAFPRLAHLHVAGLPSGVYSFLNALRAPRNVEFSVVLEYEGPHALPLQDLLRLQSVVGRLYSKTALEGFMSLFVDTSYSSPEDPDAGQCTTITLRDPLTRSNHWQPTQLKIAVVHMGALRTDDWRALLDFIGRALPADRATRLQVSHQPFLAGYPWHHLLQRLPRITRCTLGDAAPQSLAAASTASPAHYGELQGDLARLKELRLVESTLSDPHYGYGDGRPDGMTTINSLARAFNTTGVPSGDRELIVQGCSLEPSMAEFSRRQDRRIKWLDNEVIAGVWM